MSERDTKFDYFDACMRQSELAHQSFDGRRQAEWKVAFVFWTLVALTTYTLPEGYPFRVIIPSALAAFILYLFWLWVVWHGDERDIQRRNYFRDEGEKFLRLPGYRLKEEEFAINDSKLGIRSFFRDWFVRWQLITTVMLLFAFSCMAGRIGQNQQRRSTVTETGQLNSLAISTSRASVEAARSAAEAAESAWEAAKLASDIARASLQSHGTEKLKREQHEPGHK